VVPLGSGRITTPSGGWSRSTAAMCSRIAPGSSARVAVVDQPLHPVPVRGGRGARRVRAARGRRACEIADGPLDAARRVVATGDGGPEDGGGVASSVAQREQQVASAALRDAQFGEVEDRRCDAVARLLEGRTRGGYRTPDVVADCRDVLDEHSARTEDLGRPGDPDVEAVAVVVSAGVVVEVRMALTGWPCQQDVHFAYLGGESRLCGAGRTADGPLKERGHVLAGHGDPGEVEFEDVGGVRVLLDGCDDLDPAADPLGSLGEAEAEAAAAAEEVDHPQLRGERLVVWPARLPDEFGVLGTDRASLHDPSSYGDGAGRGRIAAQPPGSVRRSPWRQPCPS